MNKRKITSKPYNISPIRYCMVMILSHQGRREINILKKEFDKLFLWYDIY